jgi:hypothetical protein
MAVIEIRHLDDYDPRTERTPPRRYDRCGRRRVLTARVLEQ